MDFLKRKKVRIVSLGMDLEIRQLSAKANSEIVAAYKGQSPHNAGFIAVKYGVPEWSAMTIDEIGEGLSMEHVNEINDAISKLSGIDEKNSDSTQTESSSSS